MRALCQALRPHARQLLPILIIQFKQNPIRNLILRFQKLNSDLFFATKRAKSSHANKHALHIDLINTPNINRGPSVEFKSLLRYHGGNFGVVVFE